ncbi:MAG: hypothetical protein QMA93_03480 [Acidimicrobiales bacterium]
MTNLNLEAPRTAIEQALLTDSCVHHGIIGNLVIFERFWLEA